MRQTNFGCQKKLRVLLQKAILPPERRAGFLGASSLPSFHIGQPLHEFGKGRRLGIDCNIKQICCIYPPVGRVARDTNLIRQQEGLSSFGSVIF